MNYPSSIKHRDKLDALTGIKSSLNQLRSVISLAYLIYVANDRKSEADYSISDGSNIKLNPHLHDRICHYLGKYDIDELFKNNPLIKCQFEPLYVGITLLLKLGNITMRGKSSTIERTGGQRYPKQLLFANNMVILDLILEGFPEDVRTQSLAEWLENKTATDTVFENRMKCFITTCTTFTQFKLRNNVGDEVFFQTEGIYEQALLDESGVAFEDSHEFVGPSRIFNNILKENLEPWLSINRGVVTISDTDGINSKSMKEILSNTLDIYNVSDDSVSVKLNDDFIEGQSHQSYQQIFYGAPGTGKSNKIKKLTDGHSVIRTTFHPDSDYSTFVGCYKPTISDEETRVVPVVVTSGISLEQNNGTYKEKHITYRFVMQAFLKAYLGAWKKYVDKEEDNASSQFLVIEEINRGNCAQIFGDLFQLLDRSDNGFSEYPIEADTDLQQEISRAFTEYDDYKLNNAISVEGAVKNYTSNYNSTLSEDIQNGRVLLLPPNLYIWATMNTSDQSLFPIDSAFKRRWDWVYIPIDTHKEEWYISVNGIEYSWPSFLDKINDDVLTDETAEDKHLGFYFCKAEDNIISAEKIVSKVLFYLWNDVFKVYGVPEMLTKGDKNMTFHKFYNTDGTINETLVAKLLDNIGVEKKVKEHTTESASDETVSTTE